MAHAIEVTEVGSGAKYGIPVNQIWRIRDDLPKATIAYGAAGAFMWVEESYQDLWDAITTTPAP